MSITKRTLTKWRKEALKANTVFIDLKSREINTFSTPVDSAIVLSDRILLMTQELLDQELLKEANKDEG